MHFKQVFINNNMLNIHNLTRPKHCVILFNGIIEKQI